MLSAVIPSVHSYPAARLAPRQVHQMRQQARLVREVQQLRETARMLEQVPRVWLFAN